MNIQALAENINTTLYTNRWIAIVRGRVVAVGLTARQAHRAAKIARPKDTPQILFIDANGNPGVVKLKPLSGEGWLNSRPLLQKVIKILLARQQEAYLVGGAVRDLLLDRDQTAVDLDLAVPADGLVVARQVADALGAAFYPLDPERGTGRVVITGPEGKIHLDFATWRGPTLQADLADRDFTINAIALNLTTRPPQLVDPLDGQQDLRAGLVRAVSTTSLSHDPVRTLRAVRQATELGFTIEAGTQQLIRQAAAALPDVSPERRRDELLKLLNTPAPGQAVRMLHKLGVLPHILPEIEATAGVEQGPPHHLDVFGHTTAALDAWARLLQKDWPDLPEPVRPQIWAYLDTGLSGDLTIRQLMPLALLWHDSGKPHTYSRRPDAAEKIRFLGHPKESARIARQVMQKLHFSNQAIWFVETVIANHMRPLLLAQAAHSPSSRAIFRFFRDTGSKRLQAGVAVALHALADHHATYPPGRGAEALQALRQVVTGLATAYFNHRNRVIDPPPLLTGRDLIAGFGLAEGRLVGVLLNRLKEAQAAGQVQDKAAALAFIQADPDFVEYQTAAKIHTTKPEIPKDN